MRTLRTYRCVAHREHFCDTCHKNILPGEYYMGTVHVVGLDKEKEHIVVLKEHCDPPCDMYTGPEGDDLLGEERGGVGAPENVRKKAA